MLEFRILGPLEVWDGEKTLDPGGQRQRAVLAVLAMHVGEVVPSERLITYLWGESPPPTAATSLQNAVSQLRKALGADVVETRAPGYALNADRDAVDARRFERLVNEARSAAAERRAALMREALQLWRGPPLSDFPYEQFVQNEAARLEELRLTAVEERIEAELELGGAAELVGELEALVRENPLRERPRGQLMLPSIAVDGRRKRFRPIRTRVGCSWTSWGSSRHRRCSSSMRRSFARSPHSSPRLCPGPGRTSSERSSARCSPGGSCTCSARDRHRKTAKASQAASPRRSTSPRSIVET